jgi:plastocyanin
MNSIMMFISFMIISISIPTSQGIFTHNAYGQLILAITYNAEAGGGNATTPLNIFHPQNITISKNGSVEWTNPTTGISYPHTVTFVLDNNIALPNAKMLNSSSNNNYLSIQNANNSKMFLNNTIIHNKIGIEPAILPTVISANNSMKYLDPQSNQHNDGPQYNFTGSEKFVNSGFIWPEGKIPTGSQNITAFTVRFNEVGVYHYQCLIHPEMTGIVTVTPPSISKFGINIGELGNLGN